MRSPEAVAYKNAKYDWWRYNHHKRYGIQFKLTGSKQVVGAIGRKPPGAHLMRINTYGDWEVGNIMWRCRFPLGQEDMKKRVRALRDGGFCLEFIASMAGVGVSTIYKFLAGVSWRSSE